MPQLYQDSLGEILRGPQDYQSGGANGGNTGNTVVPGGANMQLQYNANGVFGGVANTSYDGFDLSLGLVANIKIDGGVNQQLLSTDGLGNLSWATVDTTALDPQPVINFVSLNNSNNQTFTNPNISTFISNGYATVTRNGVTVDVSDYTISGDTLTINAFLFVGDSIDVLPTYPAPATGATPGNGTVTRVGGQGSGLGFSLTGNVTTAGNLTLTIPAASDLKNTLDIGTVADVNLNGLTNNFLTGTGTWQEINMPITGNIAELNLTGQSAQVLRGDGTWQPVAVPTGNIGNINLNGNGSQVLAGNGSWVPQGNAQSGVTQIIAGTDVTISPPSGVGVVTISAVGGNGGGGTVTSVSGNGGGLGFSLGGLVVSSGNITLTAPTQQGLRTNLNIGTVANVNTNGNTNQWLNGAGTWANIAVPTVGNIAVINLSGVSNQYLSGDGSWDAVNMPTGNIGNVNLNGITSQYLNGLGAWANIAIPTGNVANANFTGNSQQWLNANGAWANIPIPVFGNVGLLNLNGLGNQFLAGNGIWREVNMPITGNIAALNLNGNIQNWLRGDGTWANIAVPTGNIGNVNLNSDGTTWLRGNGTFANIAVPTGNIGNASFNGSNIQYLRGDGNWAVPVSGAAGSNTQVQFNNNSALAGAAGFTYNNSTVVLSLGTVVSGGTLEADIIRPKNGDLSLFAGTNKNINIGSNTSVSPGNITLNGQGYRSNIVIGRSTVESNTDVIFYSNNIQLGSNTAVHITGGSSGQVLSTDGSGNLSWISSGGTGTVTNVRGNGTGLGFSLSGNITTTGNLTLTAPTIADFRTIIGVGSVANTNLNNDSQLYLNGQGQWTSPASSTGVLNDIIYGTERITIASDTGGTVQFQILNNSIRYSTVPATGNITLNLSGNSTSTFSSLLSVNESLTATYLMTTGTTAYGVTQLQIDGALQTIKWAGGDSFANSIMAYTFTMIKTGASTYTVLGSATRYA